MTVSSAPTATTMNANPPADSPLARWAIRLAALWLATGALAKLFYGTPALLPEEVRAHTPFGLDLTYTLVIGVELGLVFLAFLRPRQAWPLLVAMFLFFDVILTQQLRAGAASCGCFGKSIEVSPVLMLIVDSTLLLFLVAARPWARVTAGGARLSFVLLALALAFLAPVLYLRIRQGTPEPPAPGVTPGAAPSEAAKLPDWVTLDPASWVGRSVYEIPELARWVEADRLPTDGKIVFWRQGCTHCAAHLREMANRDKGDQPLVLLQVQDDEKDSPAVDALPEGAHVARLAFPKGLQVVLETPWELTVEGGNVSRALDRQGLEAADAVPPK